MSRKEVNNWTQALSSAVLLFALLTASSSSALAQFATHITSVEGAQVVQFINQMKYKH